VEWVETTGRTVEEAKEAALDQLGVDESDAEFQILEEPKGGLFGRLRSEARVRARVQPTTPRPKLDRRDRRRRRRRGGKGDGGEEPESRVPETRVPESRSPESRRRPAETAKRESRSLESRSLESRSEEREAMTEGPGLDEQARVIEEFVDGLVDAFGFDATTESATDEEDDAVTVAVNGEGLGLLIGPRGQTLEAIQELSRTVLQRATVGAQSARVRVDVSGYRERRREALERFARQLAEEVRASGTRKALEPMGSADRKVVHDAINDIEGVSTTSEGIEPRRRVVILPASEDEG